MIVDVIEKVVLKANLFIVAGDYSYGTSLKESLEKKFEEEIQARLFPDAELCLQFMKSNGEKLDIVILDYFENKTLNESNGEHTVDYIKKASPNTAIIIVSNKNDSECAMKALAYGAQDFVMKDPLSNENIFNSVEKCLHPAKV